MKLKYSTAVVFCLFIGFFGLLSLLNFGNKLITKPEDRQEMTMEKLSKQSLLDGSFATSFESFFSEQFVMRSTFVEFGKEVELLKGIGSGETQLLDHHVLDIVQTTTSVQKIDKKLEEELYSDDGVKETTWGQILIYNSAAMTLNTFSETAAINYADSINRYGEKFPALNIYSMLIPTQVEFIESDHYRSLSVPQSETIAQINTLLSDRIKTVDVLGILHEHRNEYLYYRTDHHWTQRGAYYAYKVFAQALGEEVPAIDDYSMSTAENFLGSLYKVTLNKSIAETPDSIEVFDPFTAHSYKSLQDQIKYNDGQVLLKKWLAEEEKYAVFLGGDQAIVEIQTELKNGRRMLVLKDSFANALVPFLVDIAETIIVVDPRFYDGDIESIVSEYEITDLLFVNYASITRRDVYSPLYNKLLSLE